MNRFIQKLIGAGIVMVMPVATALAADTISLAGQWRFQIAGTNAPAYAGVLPGQTTIHLPGTMDDAGLGPENTTPPKVANKGGGNNVLAGPSRRHDYAGPAWYQRDLEIPAAWQGKRVTLFLERCRWTTTVWLDNRRIGSQDSLITPHIYDLGTGLAPGKHRLTICVDSTVKIDLGKFVSVLFGGTWGNMNGIIGRIELAATPPVWIDGVQVYPNAMKKTALVKVRIGNQSGKAGKGNLFVSVANQTFPEKDLPATPMPVFVKWDKTGGQVEFEVAPQDGQVWDEFTPQLYRIGINLLDLAGDGKEWGDTRSVIFGLRDFAARGTQFTMNDQPVFLRGTVESSTWPLTGYPPTDEASWHRIFQIEKAYGLNYIRFHSWCPPEAAFEAADEEGILIQAEGPMANVKAGQDPRRDAFMAAELKRIVDTYGNHPSFCLMTLGNEFGGKDEVLTDWVQMLRQRDPRHLYSSASNNRQRTENRQFTESKEGRGIQSPGTGRDLRAVVAGETVPVIGHEIAQWVFYPNFDEIKKWTGVMALKNYEWIRNDLKAKGLLDLAPKFVAATGRQAVLLYKEEVEVLLRTPGYGGFSLLALNDYPTQGTATIGPLDAFWDSKGFITSEQFSRFCGPVVPLLRMPQRTCSAGESFSATADLANFGPQNLAGAQPFWKITDERGNEIAGGEMASLTAPTGKLSPLGTISASLARAVAPCKLIVTVGLKGTKISNWWDIWVYPDAPAPQPPAGVVVSVAWDEATKTALAAGKTVLLLPGKPYLDHSLAGSFLPTFWSPVWFPKQKPDTMSILCDPRHPLFAQFPTEFYSDWQWYDLQQNSRPLILDDTPADFRPLVEVIDNFARNHKLGSVFEARVGNGKLLVCSIDITSDLANRPAARQFARSLYAYVGSAKFQPASSLSVETLEMIFTSTSTSQPETK